MPVCPVTEGKKGHPLQASTAYTKYGCRCDVCRAHKATKTAGYRQRNPDNHSSWYARKKQEGMCVNCGTSPAEDGNITCRPCAEKNRQRYYDEREDRLAYARKLRRHNTLMLICAMGGECFDCGGFFPPKVFEFHHRNPEEKEGNVANFMKSSWDVLIEEARKCDLLCANCHRMRH